jgi:hypothetical protein
MSEPVVIYQEGTIVVSQESTSVTEIESSSPVVEVAAVGGIRGPQGPAGDDGAQGPQGLQGDPGPAGEDGAQGPPGDDGATGATGPPGTTTWAGITDKPAVITNTTASFTAADETKLDGIEALADVTDAANVSAAGALMATDAPELIRDTMGTALVAGSGITVTPSDGSDTITIAATGGSSGPVLPAWRTGTSNRISTVSHGMGKGTIAGIACSANIAYFGFIAIPNAGTLVDISINVVTQSSTGSARIGIFSYDATGDQMTRLLDCGTVSTATNGNKTITIGYGFTAGPYWIGIVLDEAATIRGSSPSIGSSHVIGTTNIDGGLSASMTYGTFPTTVGTLSAISNSYPVFWLRR